MMSAQPIAIKSTGLVTSVGLSVPVSCAAFRARISNPSETRFMDSGGEWIMAHQVPLEQPWRGLPKLAKMAAMAIAEALQDMPKKEWSELLLILCVAELGRPGRMAGLDDRLLPLIQAELGVTFSSQSFVVSEGRVGVAVALAQARRWLAEPNFPRLLVAATDSLMSWSTLSHYDQKDRLISARNSDGFMPGEAAGAMLLGAPTGGAGEVVCTGIGFGREPAHIDSELPLRADGLSQAFKAALTDSGCQMHDIDFRITDNSGEQYYFKEAALALSRILHVRKEDFDIWHPAECTGEVGAASGASIIATVQAACDKQYTKGPTILAHMANDDGQRAALTLQYGVAG
jgi:3-oxoacyl-[acyl-carrier-protein] synthase-1